MRSLGGPPYTVMWGPLEAMGGPLLSQVGPLWRYPVGALRPLYKYAWGPLKIPYGAPLVFMQGPCGAPHTGPIYTPVWGPPPLGHLSAPLVRARWGPYACRAPMGPL